MGLFGKKKQPPARITDDNRPTSFVSSASSAERGAYDAGGGLKNNFILKENLKFSSREFSEVERDEIDTKFNF
jgi:hypothetical protein